MTSITTKIDTNQVTPVTGQQPVSQIQKLPDVIMNHISNFISVGELSDARTLCRSWKNVLPTELDLSSHQITDREFAEIIKKYPHVNKLTLWCRNITGASVAELIKLKNLKELCLVGPNNISHRDLAQLANLPQLNKVEFAVQRLDERDFALFASFNQLNELTLSGMHMTVKNLDKLLHLNKLNLDCPDVTNKMLAQLAQMQNLNELRIRCSRVTDDGLDEIAKLQNLTKLDLSYTRITDAGLMKLVRMPNLKEIILNGCTDITENGLEQFRKAKLSNYQGKALECLNECRVLNEGTLYPDGNHSPLHNLMASYLTLPNLELRKTE